jgi:hypothetical protein
MRLSPRPRTNASQQCSAERPSCAQCRRLSTVCEYTTRAEETHSQASKRKYRELLERPQVEDSPYREFTRLLTSMTPQEAMELVTRIQAGQDIEAVLNSVKAGNVLLQLSTVPGMQPQSNVSLSRVSATRPGSNPVDGTSLEVVHTFRQRNDKHVADASGQYRDNSAPDMVLESTSRLEMLDRFLRLVRSSNQSVPEWVHLLRGNAISEARTNLARLLFESRQAVIASSADNSHPVLQISTLSGRPPLELPAQPWTIVTTDDFAVSHLVSTYWTWQYHQYPSLIPETFIRAMKAKDISSLFCSPLLVNAILAVACVSLLPALEKKRLKVPTDVHRSPLCFCDPE